MTEKDETVTDKIGDEYQSWKPHDRVFISSPTGTGKTHFILNVLLKYACQQRKKILYLVNRRILKEQLETELSQNEFDERCQIDVESITIPIQDYLSGGYKRYFRRKLEFFVGNNS